MVLYCYTNSFSNINLCTKYLIMLFGNKGVLLEAITCTLLILHCYIEILIFGMSQYFIQISFSRFSGSHDSLVFTQSGSCFILYRITCMYWTLIMYNGCPHWFSNNEFLSWYVRQWLLWYTLASTSRTIGRICWILYLYSTIFIIEDS